MKLNKSILYICLLICLSVPIILYAIRHKNDKQIVYGPNGKPLCSQKEYRRIHTAAYEGLRSNSSEDCSKYSSYVLINIYRKFALVNVRPDMKKCINDPIYIILKLTDNNWEYATLTMGEIDYELDPNFGFEVPSEIWNFSSGE